MPTYGYKCKKCKDTFEVFQKMSDKPVQACPKCGGDVQRVFHPVGIIFKGSGFYTTDYARKSTTTAGESKSDTKSDAKSETKGTDKTGGKQKKDSSTDAPAKKPEKVTT